MLRRKMIMDKLDIAKEIKRNNTQEQEMVHVMT